MAKRKSGARKQSRISAEEGIGIILFISIMVSFFTEIFDLIQAQYGVNSLVFKGIILIGLLAWLGNKIRKRLRSS